MRTATTTAGLGTSFLRSSKASVYESPLSQLVRLRSVGHTRLASLSVATFRCAPCDLPKTNFSQPSGKGIAASRRCRAASSSAAADADVAGGAARRWAAAARMIHSSMAGAVPSTASVRSKAVSASALRRSSRYEMPRSSSAAVYRGKARTAASSARCTVPKSRPRRAARARRSCCTDDAHEPSAAAAASAYSAAAAACSPRAAAASAASTGGGSSPGGGRGSPRRASASLVVARWCCEPRRRFSSMSRERTPMSCHGSSSPSSSGGTSPCTRICVLSLGGACARADGVSWLHRLPEPGISVLPSWRKRRCPASSTNTHSVCSLPGASAACTSHQPEWSWRYAPRPPLTYSANSPRFSFCWRCSSASGLRGSIRGPYTPLSASSVEPPTKKPSGASLTRT